MVLEAITRFFGLEIHYKASADLYLPDMAHSDARHCLRESTIPLTLVIVVAIVPRLVEEGVAH
jgi:hypothetical protein